jgi:hypothetical protein
MASVNFPRLDFSGGQQMAQSPYGNEPLSPLLAGASGFMTGMEQAEKRRREKMEEERELRRMQQEEMMNQMRVKEMEMRFEEMKLSRQDKEAERGYKEREMGWREKEANIRLGQLEESVADKKLMSQAREVVAGGRKKMSEVDPNNLDDIKTHINSVYEDLMAIGQYDQANAWMTQYGSAGEEQLRLLDVENKRVAASMKSEMENQRRVLEKYISSDYNFNALSEDERQAIGGVELPKDKADTVYRKAVLASANYDPKDVMKNINGFRDSWAKSRSSVVAELDPDRRIELAADSDRMLGEMVDAYQMYSPIPTVAAMIQMVPDDWSSRTVDDAYLYAFDFYDKQSKSSNAKRDARKSASAKAAEYRVAYEEMTGETVEQGKRRMMAERSSRAGASAPQQPQGVGASMAPAAQAAPQAASPGLGLGSSGAQNPATSDFVPASPGEDIPTFGSIQEVVAWARSPEGMAYAGRTMKIRVAGTVIDYPVPR